MNELKRYEIPEGNGRYSIDSELVDDGTYCLHSEASAMLAEKDAEIERLRKLNSEATVTGLVVCAKNRRLLEVLESIVYDTEHCDRSYEECDHDYVMTDTDAYRYAKQALAATAQDINHEIVTKTRPCKNETCVFNLINACDDCSERIDSPAQGGKDE